MKKKLLMLMIGLFFIPNIVNAYEMKYDWEKFYEDQSYNLFRNVVLLDNGDTVVLYDTSNKGYSTDDYQAFIKLDKDGNEVWFKKLDKAINVKQIALNDQGGFVVVGSTTLSKIGENNNNGKSDAIIMNYDKDGNLLWQNNYGTVENDLFEYVIFDDDVYFTFGTKNSKTSNGIVAKYDKNGNFISYIDLDLNFAPSNTNWSYDFFNFKLLSDESIILSGDRIRSLETEFEHQDFIVKYNKNGGFEWSKIDTGYTDVDYINIDITIDEKDNIIVISEKNKGERASYLKKYDSNGNLVGEYEFKDHSLRRIYYFNHQYILLTNNDMVNIIFWDENIKIIKENKFKYENWISDIFYDFKRKNLFFLSSFNNMGHSGHILIKYSPEYNIDILDSLNGSSIGTKEDEYGIVTTKPDDKYFVEQIIVKDSKDNIVQVTKDKDNQYIFELNDDVTVEVIFARKYTITVNPIVNGKATAEQYENGKGRINAVANEKYVLDEIKIINTKGEEIAYEEKDGYYYFDVNDDLVITVTFKELPKEVVKDEQVENPRTVDMFIYYSSAIICTLFGIWAVEQYKKYMKIKEQ